MLTIGFFDLETTGLPKIKGYRNYYDPTDVEKYDSSRIVQICLTTYEISDKTYKQTALHNYIIKPSGFEIKNDHIHGIKQETAVSTGIPFVQAIDLLRNDLRKCRMLVAHNIIFDQHVLLSELHRYGLAADFDFVNKISKFCTSYDCRSITKLEGRGGDFKQPKLNELYKFLFNDDAKGLHDAGQDVNVLSQCFFKMFELGYISIKAMESI